MSAIPLVQATAPTAVVKRDGRRVPFDAGKIESAIANCPRALPDLRKRAGSAR